jgi:anaerobic selenocysteine-containing dehydrogenase
MTYRKNRPLSRRDFLKLSGIGLTAAGLSPLIQACGGPAATTVAPAATAAPAVTQVPSGKIRCGGGASKRPSLENG